MEEYELKVANSQNNAISADPECLSRWFTVNIIRLI